MRDAFEKAFGHLSLRTFMEDGCAAYCHPKTQGAWEGWQAAYAAGMERAAEICDQPDAIDAEDCAALIRYEITKEPT